MLTKAAGGASGASWVTRIAAASETMAPTDKSMPPAMTTMVWPAASTISGRKVRKLPLSGRGSKRLGCKYQLTPTATASSNSVKR
jgi:hypothetical protein